MCQFWSEPGGSGANKTNKNNNSNNNNSATTKTFIVCDLGHSQKACQFSNLHENRLTYLLMCAALSIPQTQLIKPSHWGVISVFFLLNWPFAEPHRLHHLSVETFSQREECIGRETAQRKILVTDKHTTEGQHSLTAGQVIMSCYVYKDRQAFSCLAWIVLIYNIHDTEQVWQATIKYKSYFGKWKNKVKPLGERCITKVCCINIITSAWLMPWLGLWKPVWKIYEQRMIFFFFYKKQFSIHVFCLITLLSV